MSDCSKFCGYKYYDQNKITANPKTSRTDCFVRFLLCNQKSVQQLYQALYFARQLPSEGRFYCYRYFNIFDCLPTKCKCIENSFPKGQNYTTDCPPNCENYNCQNLVEKKCESKVYQSPRLFVFYLTANKMRQDKDYCDKVLSERRIEVYNPNYQWKQPVPPNVTVPPNVQEPDNPKASFEIVELDNLDVQVLLLFKLQYEIEQLYLQGTFSHHFVSQGKYYCYLVNFTHDFCGNKLRPLNYSGRALKELFLTYSTNYTNDWDEFTTGKSKCLLTRCPPLKPCAPNKCNNTQEWRREDCV